MVAIYCLCPILSNDKSDASLGLPMIFLNNASNSDYSAIPSDSNSSNEFKSDSKESKDKLASNNEEE